MVWELSIKKWKIIEDSVLKVQLCLTILKRNVAAFLFSSYFVCNILVIIYINQCKARQWKLRFLYNLEQTKTVRILLEFSNLLTSRDFIWGLCRNLHISPKLDSIWVILKYRTLIRRPSPPPPPILEMWWAISCVWNLRDNILDKYDKNHHRYWVKYNF